MIVSTLRSAKYVVLLALAFASVPVSAQNLLANPGFEDPPFAGAEDVGAGSGWATFGANFRVQQSGGGCDPISCAGAHGGTVALKVFGQAGAFQDFAATAGEAFEGSVWAINPQNADAMADGQVAAVNIEWHGAGGFIDAAFGTTIDGSHPLDIWTLLSVSGTAPAGTTFARYVVITGDFAGTGGGAPRFDDASFGPATGGPDTDDDGVPDDDDLCAGTASSSDVDDNGCSDAQVDGDGDGVCDPGALSSGPSACSGTDNCPVDANPGQGDFDDDGVGDACDDDIDGDTVLNDDDFCTETAIPEGVPTQMLLVNRWALTDDDDLFDFDTVRRGRARAGYSIEDTAGCSCEQIIPQLLDPMDQEGHRMFGCSISVMDEFVELVTP